MKRILAVLIALAALLSTGCAEAQGCVVATNFPCYDLARQVAGDALDVKLLIRPGSEVHSYEPTPADILTIGGASLFVYIGGENDVWADGILESFGADAPASVRLIDSVSALEETHEHGEGEHEHELDEHIWTSPKNALRMLRAVEAALCAAQPTLADAFHANADAYYAEIERIDAELTELVDGAARRKLVFADRFPFLYLAHDYGLSYEAAFASCAAETEPSAQTLVSLIHTIIEEKIPVVYTIELSAGTIARTLQEETGVPSRTLHSAQTVSQAEFESGETYVSIMEKNLSALREGLY